MTNLGSSRWSRAFARGVVRGPLQLHISVSLRLELSEGEVAKRGQFEAREARADELDELLGDAGLQVQRASSVGRPPWRAFLVMINGRPVHHTFVTLERSEPRLFKVYTHPIFRRQGAFQFVMPVLTRALREDGYTSLESSCNAANLASVAAHQLAGFRITHRTVHPYVLGIPLRPLARRGRALLRSVLRIT